MSELQHLLIFDIDGTLLNTGGLTRIAFENAALKLYGKENSTKGIVPFGLTDKVIFEMMLENIGVKKSRVEEKFTAFVNLFAEFLEQELFNSDIPSLEKGVSELLVILAKEPDIFLSIGTGNIEKTANLKLKRLGILDYFPVGGYGNDGKNRKEIIRTAHQTASEYYKINFPWA